MWSPNGNENSTIMTIWQSEPKARGTWNILSSCLLTLALCVWTAVHLNVPTHEDSPQRQLRLKLGWLAMGVFTPEMVVAATAYQQWRDARELTEAMRKILQGSATTSTEVVDPEVAPMEPKTPQISNFVDVRQKSWTNVHSHFAVMGGFATESPEGAALPNDKERVAIAWRGLKALFEKEPSIIPDIHENQVKEKSKANHVGKVLVCIQALWFAAQRFSRMILHLKISLLELNTLGHCLCALLIYRLWWDKPLDVSEPHVLSSSNIRSLSSLMAMASSFTEHHYKNRESELEEVSDATAVSKGRSIRFRFEQMYSATCLLPGDSELVREPLSSQQTPPSANPLHIYGIENRLQQSMQGGHTPGAPIPRKLYMGQHYHGFTYSRKKFITPSLAASKGILGIKRPFIDFDSIRRRRWLSAASAIKIYELALLLLNGNFHIRNSLTNRVRNWPNVGHWEASWPLYIIFSVAGLLYGGLHLIAWDAHFNSEVEKILWRLSGLTITATGFVIPGLGLQHLLTHRKRPSIVDWCPRWMHDTVLLDLINETLSFVLLISMSSYFVLMVILIPLYPLARVFLIVECFLDLSYLPQSAYMMPNWAQYMPHLD